MVESMIRYSRSGFSPSPVKSRFQTPFFAHRRKRLNTLFHLPNSSGRSRQGAPARTSHNTASTNKRLSAPCRPLSPFLPGISDSIRCHSPSVKARRIKIASPVAILNHIRESAGIPLMSTGPSGLLQSIRRGRNCGRDPCGRPCDATTGATTRGAPIRPQ
jgi:hypothetical protein